MQNGMMSMRNAITCICGDLKTYPSGVIIELRRVMAKVMAIWAATMPRTFFAKLT